MAAIHPGPRTMALWHGGTQALWQGGTASPAGADENYAGQSPARSHTHAGSPSGLLMLRKPENLSRPLQPVPALYHVLLTLRESCHCTTTIPKLDFYCTNMHRHYNY